MGEKFTPKQNPTSNPRKKITTETKSKLNSLRTTISRNPNSKLPFEKLSAQEKAEKKIDQFVKKLPAPISQTLKIPKEHLTISHSQQAKINNFRLFIQYNHHTIYLNYNVNIETIKLPDLLNSIKQGYLNHLKKIQEQKNSLKKEFEERRKKFPKLMKQIQLDLEKKYNLPHRSIRYVMTFNTRTYKINLKLTFKAKGEKMSHTIKHDDIFPLINKTEFISKIEKELIEFFGKRLEFSRARILQQESIKAKKSLENKIFSNKFRTVMELIRKKYGIIVRFNRQGPTGRLYFTLITHKGNHEIQFNKPTTNGRIQQIFSEINQMKNETERYSKTISPVEIAHLRLLSPLLKIVSNLKIKKTKPNGQIIFSFKIKGTEHQVTIPHPNNRYHLKELLLEALAPKLIPHQTLEENLKEFSPQLINAIKKLEKSTGAKIRLFTNSNDFSRNVLKFRAIYKNKTYGLMITPPPTTNQEIQNLINSLTHTMLNLAHPTTNPNETLKQNAAQIFNKANNNFQSGKFKEAIKQYLHLIKLSRQNNKEGIFLRQKTLLAELYTNLGASYLFTDQYTQANKAFDQAYVNGATDQHLYQIKLNTDLLNQIENIYQKFDPKKHPKQFHQAFHKFLLKHGGLLSKSSQSKLLKNKNHQKSAQVFKQFLEFQLSDARTGFNKTKPHPQTRLLESLFSATPISPIISETRKLINKPTLTSQELTNLKSNLKFLIKLAKGHRKFVNKNLAISNLSAAAHNSVSQIYKIRKALHSIFQALKHKPSILNKIGHF